MKLYEYQTKKILKENNVTIPRGFVCSDEEEVRNAFAVLGEGGKELY